MEREKICAVLGLARSGVPAARFLVARGARVVGYDNRTLEQLGADARELRELGVELRLGDHGYAGLSECSIIVLSPGLKVHHKPLASVLARAVAAGVEVIGELELAARHCPAPMIAVTGTKGKSTTVKLIAEIMNACGVPAVRAGNTGIPLTAELPNLAPTSWAIVEVSSFQLERAPTFKPRIAVLLSLLEDHQDYHPSLEQYWATKLKLFAHQGPDETAIFNLDDERIEELWRGEGGLAPYMSAVRATRVASTARRTNPDGVQFYTGRFGNALGFGSGPNFEPVLEIGEIPLRGEHNLSNIAAALTAVDVALCESQQVLLDRAGQHAAMAAAVAAFESLPHRLEIVGTAQGITWVNDSQATIAQAAIRALQAFPAPVTLIAGGRAKLENADAFDQLGRATAQSAHFLIAIGEAAEKICGAALRGGLDAGKIVDAHTLAEAVRVAAEVTPAGGTVVLSPACASFDQFGSYEERGEAFRQFVAALPGRVH